MKNLNPFFENYDKARERQLAKLEKIIAKSTNPLQRRRLYMQYQRLMGEKVQVPDNVPQQSMSNTVNQQASNINPQLQQDNNPDLQYNEQ